MPAPVDGVPEWSRRLIALADSDPGRAVLLAYKADAAADSAWILFTQGWTLLCWERFAGARDVLNAAADAFAASPDHLGALLCAYALLVVDQRQLVRQGLDEEFAILAERLAEAGEPLLAARARLDQARQLNVLGRSRESEALLDQLASADSGRDPLEQARQWRVRAVAAYLQGDYGRAAALLEQAEDRFSGAGQELEQARCWFERAVLAGQQEHLDKAMRQCARAEGLFNAFDLPLQRAFCLRAMGFFAIGQGQYGQALRQTRRALDLFRTLGRERDVGGCTLNLGNIYFHSGSWAAALGAYARAEEQFLSAGIVGLQTVVQRNRAMVYRASGRPSEAAALLAAAEQQAATQGYQAEVAEVWAVQAALLADEGRVADAMARYDAARERFAALGNAAAAAECLLDQGMLALQTGGLDAAEGCFAAAAPVLAGRGHHAWRVRYGQARCAELRGDPTTAIAHYARAATIVATLRRRLASESLSSQLYTQARRLHADALRLAVARHDPGAALRFAESQRALTLQQLVVEHAGPADAADLTAHDELRRQIETLLDDANQRAALDTALEAYDELLLHLRHAAPEAPALDTALGTGTLDLERIRAAICAAYGDDWTALVYTVADERLIMIGVTPHTLSLDSRPYDAQLRRLIDRASQPQYRYFTFNDVPWAQGLAPRPWDDLTTLAAQLLPDEVRARLHADHRLLIIPAGPLHLLPWAALRIDGNWLIERAVVQLLPSLTLAPELLKPRAPAKQALAIGCSSFRGRAAELPAVAGELAIVAAAWPGPCERRFEQEATRAALLEARHDELALLHLASHAQLLASRALAAHVKLWDGNLLLSEITGMRLGGALVVLSACDGAAADVLPGEEVLSLAWAFLAGGACSVVASLWPLSDPLAPPIIAALYAQLAAGHDPALALAQAQRVLLAGAAGAGATGPQLWAALQVVGGCAARK